MFSLYARISHAKNRAAMKQWPTDGAAGKSPRSASFSARRFTVVVESRCKNAKFSRDRVNIAEKETRDQARQRGTELRDVFGGTRVPPMPYQDIFGSPAFRNCKLQLLIKCSPLFFRRPCPPESSESATKRMDLLCGA